MRKLQKKPQNMVKLFGTGSPSVDDRSLVTDDSIRNTFTDGLELESDVFKQQMVRGLYVSV